MSKTMCKMDAATRLEKQSKGLRFSCKKCGERAFKEKHLCKPKEIKTN